MKTDEQKKSDAGILGPLKKAKQPIGCYLGWEGCTNTADVQVGNGWVCWSCWENMRKG